MKVILNKRKVSGKFNVIFPPNVEMEFEDGRVKHPTMDVWLKVEPKDYYTIGDVFKVRHNDGTIFFWDIDQILAEVNQNEDVLEGSFIPYTKDDWKDGWNEGNDYELLSVNDRAVFGTFACKDLVEEMLESIYGAMGISTPDNHEDITQYCYEDVMACADPKEWHSGDVAIAFRRFIESIPN